MTSLDPAGRELERLAERWRTLPIGQALRHADRVRVTAQRYADRLAEHTGRRSVPVRDLGPAAALAQLRAATYDALRLGALDDAAVADDLRALRAAL